MKFFAVFAACIAIAVAAPVQTIWSLPEIDSALQNPNTNPALIPYLDHALNTIMEALFAGQQIESVVIPLPADIAVGPIQVAPSPVEIVHNPVDVASVPASSSLVQIIINVNQEGQVAAPSPVPAPALIPEINPTPVIVVDEAIEVSPVEVEIAPEPVQVVNPAEVNPIDVIAVGAIDYNPIDILQPIPVNPAGGPGILV